MNNPDRLRVGDRVTIFPRGKNRLWMAEFWHSGSHCRVSLKTRNRKVAVQRAVRLDAQLVDGKYKKVVRTTAIDSAVKDYLGHLETEDRARKTIVRYRGELNTFANYCKKRRARLLSQITPVLFDGFRAERRKTHSAKTLYHEGVVVKQFLKWCVSRHLIAENPLQGIRLEKPILEPKPAPTLDEVCRILAASTPRQRAMLAVLAYTGLRSGELRQLRPEDVDLEGNWIHVVSRPGAATKTRCSRKVPIHPVLQELLAVQPRSTGPWYFAAEPSRKYPAGDHWISTKRLNESLIRTASKLGLPTGRSSDGYTIHSLRHFFETHCVNAGIPQRVIDTWLGHWSDRSMAAVYYRLSDAESQAFIVKVPFGAGVPAADAGKSGG